ncbi:MAG: class I SAM-dependent rRNA methyltransferase [Oscillospiraceae bacterium]|nr:class I SAM-dependent rRNA methyltransferase [Oscillospiraceae bacterium]
MEDLDRITLSARAEKEIKNGFPWAYDTEVSADEQPRDGDVCLAYSEKGKYIAAGFYNSASKLRFRVVSTNANDRIDEQFWARRIRWAVDYRRRVMGEDFSCCRLIFGDADGFPGLTVDRYGDVLSAEVNCLGMDRIKDVIYRELLGYLSEIGETITSVRERSEGRHRQLEGLPDFTGYISVPGFDLTGKREIMITENGIRYAVDVEHGQKTGYFLDQKYNRAAAARIAKDLNVLDCCTHTGGFALNCAAAGASSVLGIDISQTAVDQSTRNAQLNGLGNVSFEKHDVFDFLADALKAGRKDWNMIILDPPAFTKSRSTVKNADSAYEELNLLAMRLLPRGGYLVTCSCSRFMTPDLFQKAIARAAYRARVSLKLIEKRGASPDHPVLVGAPDTEYLKCFICQVV